MVTTCSECATFKKDCPYLGAYNSKIDGHQACDEAFTSKHTRTEEL